MISSDDEDDDGEASDVRRGSDTGPYTDPYVEDGEADERSEEAMGAIRDIITVLKTSRREATDMSTATAPSSTTPAMEHNPGWFAPLGPPSLTMDQVQEEAGRSRRTLADEKEEKEAVRFQRLAAQVKRRFGYVVEAVAMYQLSMKEKADLLEHYVVTLSTPPTPAPQQFGYPGMYPKKAPHSFEKTEGRPQPRPYISDSSDDPWSSMLAARREAERQMEAHRSAPRKVGEVRDVTRSLHRPGLAVRRESELQLEAGLVPLKEVAEARDIARSLHRPGLPFGH